MNWEHEFIMKEIICIYLIKSQNSLLPPRAAWSWPLKFENRENLRNKHFKENSPHGRYWRSRDIKSGPPLLWFCDCLLLPSKQGTPLPSLGTATDKTWADLKTKNGPKAVCHPSLIQLKLNCKNWPHKLDSIATSLFVMNWLSWQIVSDDKIQITILILRRGALSKYFCRKRSEDKIPDRNATFWDQNLNTFALLSRKCFISKWTSGILRPPVSLCYLVTSLYTIRTKLSIDNFKHIVYKK